MPMICEVKDVAERSARLLDPRCTKAEFLSFVHRVVSAPAAWGGHHSWPSRPNWYFQIVGQEIARAVWKKPFHPQMLPRIFVGLPYRMAVSLVWDGYSPESIALTTESAWYVGQLAAPSGGEAHEWLASIAANRKFGGADWERWSVSFSAWFLRHCPDGIRGTSFRSPLVMRWAREKRGWKGWKAPIPVGYGADGVMRTVDPSGLLDLVTEEHLTGGVKTSPEKVFRAIAEKTSKEELLAIAKRNAPLPVAPWGELPRGIRQLTSARELVEEGNALTHCVGGYEDICRNKGVFIFHVTSPSGGLGSTVEVGKNGTVIQHRAKGNSTPSRGEIIMVDSWLSTIKKRKEEQ